MRKTDASLISRERAGLLNEHSKSRRQRPPAAAPDACDLLYDELDMRQAPNIIAVLFVDTNLRLRYTIFSIRTAVVDLRIAYFTDSSARSLMRMPATIGHFEITSNRKELEYGKVQRK